MTEVRELESLNKVVGKVRKLEEFKNLKIQVQEANINDKKEKAAKIQQRMLIQKRQMNRDRKKQIMQGEKRIQLTDEKVNKKQSSMEREVTYKKEAARLRQQEIEDAKREKYERDQY